jgi:hypothetical protein
MFEDDGGDTDCHAALQAFQRALEPAAEPGVGVEIALVELNLDRLAETEACLPVMRSRPADAGGSGWSNSPNSGAVCRPGRAANAAVPPPEACPQDTVGRRHAVVSVLTH